MAALIEWDTVGAIAGESLAAGVVIVSAFAIGARLVATVTDDRRADRSDVKAIALAAVCFLVALAAAGYGVYFTVDK